jgi:hypothetical protein
VCGVVGQKTSPAVVLLRLFSGISIGSAGIMFSYPSLFWYATGCFYIGLITLAIDIRQELKLKRHKWKRRFGWMMVLILGCAFSFGIAFYPAAIGVQSTSYEGQYKEGESEYGITWKDDMSDLRVDLENPTERDYDHIDLTISVGNLLVQDQKQVTNVPGVTLIPYSHQIHIILVDDNGKTTGEQNRSMNAYSEVRVLCDRLPKKTTVGLIFAVSDLTPKAREVTGGVPITKEDTIVVLKLMPPYRMLMRKRAGAIKITGGFAVWNRPYSMDKGYIVKAE